MNWFQRARPLAIRIGETAWGHRLGEQSYWWLATELADRWREQSDVHSVALRGGMTRHLKVGVSDLDFTLFLRSLTPPSLTGWKRQFDGARRTWGVIGEPILATASSWKLFWALAPATVHWYGKQKSWDGERWKPLDRTLPPIHPGSRFSFAWDWYRQAIKFEHRWHLGKDEVSRELGRRTLDKLSGYLGEPSPRWLPVWRALDGLAHQTEGVTPPTTPLGAEDPLSHGLRDHFQKRSRLTCAPTRVPFVWEVSADRDVFFHWSHYRRRHPRVPPVAFVTPAMHAVLQRGWCGWSPTDPLPFERWTGRRGITTPEQRQTVRERLANDLISLPGRYLWFGPTTYQREIKRIAGEVEALLVPSSGETLSTENPTPSPSIRQWLATQRHTGGNGAEDTVRWVQWLREDVLCVR